MENEKEKWLDSSHSDKNENVRPYATGFTAGVFSDTLMKWLLSVNLEMGPLSSAKETSEK